MNYHYNRDKIKQQAFDYGWPAILNSMGVCDSFLQDGKKFRNKPCPACGGMDRYTFDNKSVNKTFFCRSCGGGDGIRLLSLINNCDFFSSLTKVADYLNGTTTPIRQQKETTKEKDHSGSLKTLGMVKKYSSRTPSKKALAYYESRGLLFMRGKRIDAIQYGTMKAYANNIDGLFPVIVGFLSTWRSPNKGLVKIYIEPNKIRALLPNDYQFNHKQLFSACNNLAGSAVWFSHIKMKTLHVGEGIETMLAVAKMQKTLSVAACCTAPLLGALELPVNEEGQVLIERLVIWADKDRADKNGRGAGIEAAQKLAARYHQCQVEIRLPPIEIEQGKKSVDWLDFYNHQYKEENVVE
jgi:putative DNA primase/helicase